MKPLLLDLFCCEGGAATGYHRAGFDVIGVDIDPQPRYPFRFIQGDALDVLSLLLTGDEVNGLTLDQFAAIHASPPCQAYSQATNMHDKSKYPDLIAPTRELLERSDLPYVLENVPGAPLKDPFMLCGSMFGIERLRRHRLFETDFPVPTRVCDHSFQYDILSVTGHGEGGSHRGGSKRGPHWGQPERKKAMGIDWMNRTKLAQAIPPAYTEWVGTQLLELLPTSKEPI